MLHNRLEASCPFRAVGRQAPRAHPHYPNGREPHPRGGAAAHVAQLPGAPPAVRQGHGRPLSVLLRGGVGGAQGPPEIQRLCLAGGLLNDLHWQRWLSRW